MVSFANVLKMMNLDYWQIFNVESSKSRFYMALIVFTNVAIVSTAIAVGYVTENLWLGVVSYVITSLIAGAASTIGYFTGMWQVETHHFK